MEMMLNLYTFQSEVPQMKRQIRRPKRNLKNIIKMNLRESGYEDDDSTDSGQSLHGNVPSGLISGGEFVFTRANISFSRIFM
jgi:hypothetical protein